MSLPSTFLAEMAAEHAAGRSFAIVRVRQKAMHSAVPSEEGAHDLAAIIDSARTGLRGARKIDLGEGTLVQEIAVIRGRDASKKESYDQAAIIDPVGLSEEG